MLYLEAEHRAEEIKRYKENIVKKAIAENE